jgi:hypothetical protein
MSKVSVKMEGAKLIVIVDLNADGEPVLKLELDIKEIPEEAWAAWKEAKAIKEA